MIEKTLLTIAIILLVLAISKPSDNYCREKVRYQLGYDGSTLERIVAPLAVNEYTVIVTDRVIYKDITDFTGQHLAIGVLTCVIWL